jgi:hypothetical protein
MVEGTDLHLLPLIAMDRTWPEVIVKQVQKKS